jgi:PhnB protein
MSVTLNPYINFRGQARAALEFYQSVFGGDLNVMSFADMPGVPTAPDEAGNVMHGQLNAANGIVLMCADVPSAMDHQPFNGSISLSGDDESTLRGYWDKLVDGGTVGEPLTQAPWGDTFGMCTDRFGINWMVNIAGAGGGASS